MNWKAAQNKTAEIIKKYGNHLTVLFAGCCLFIMLWPIYLTTHDDFNAFISYYCEGGGRDTLRGIWDYAVRMSHNASRVWPLVTYPLFIGKLLYASGNYLIYKAVCYGTMGFEIAAMYYAVKKLLNRECAQLITIVYFCAAWLDQQHNLLVSYPGGYHVAFGMFWLSLYFLFSYYKAADRRNQKQSACCYFISCVFYENMVPYALLLFLIACIAEIRKEKSRPAAAVWNAAADLRWHIGSMSFYMLVTIVWRIRYPSIYNGNVIRFDSVYDVLHTVWVFVRTQIPVYRAGELLGRTGLPEMISGMDTGYILKACIVAAVCTRIICTVRQISGKKWMAVVILSEAGAFLSVILISLTPKYIEWVKMGTSAYLSSYYVYVFHIIAFCAGVVCIYQYFPRVLRPCMGLTVFISVFLLSLCADYNNLNVRDHAFVPQQQRWETFRKVFENEEICSRLNEYDQIYVPYHQQISNTTLSEMRLFAKDRSGKEYEFYQDWEEVDAQKTVWQLDYVPDQKCMVFRQLDKQSESSGFYIISHDSLEDRLLIFEDAEKVTVSGATAEGIYGAAVYDVPEAADCVNIKGADAEKLIIVDEKDYVYQNQETISFAAEANNAPQYCLKGFSSCEGDFTWSEGKKGYLLLNLLDYKGGDLELDISVFQIFGSGRCKVSGIRGNILEADLEVGVNQVYIPEEHVFDQKLLLCFEYPDAVSPDEVSGTGDTRELAAAYSQMRLLYD